MDKLLKCVLGALCGAVLLAGVPSMADDGGSDGKDGKSVRGKSQEERVRELEQKLSEIGYTGVKGSGIKLSGYVDTSYLVNLRGHDGSTPIAGAGPSASAGTSSVFGGGRVFDHQLDEFVLNAVKLTLEKDKDDSDFPAGFRVDLMYGADANVLNNRGFAADVAVGEPFRDDVENDSDFFLEQAYVNLGLPLGDGVDVKIGKMVTLIGYEVIESPANANFSRSFAFGLAPFTQTGVTFGYNINDYVTATMGLINGPDNYGPSDTTTIAGVPNGAGNVNTEFSGVYRVDVKSPEWSVGNFNLGVSGLFGNDSAVNITAGTPGNQGTDANDNSQEINIVDVAGTWSKVFGHEPLSLGFEVFMLSQENRRVTGTTREDNSQDDLTAALYAKYQVNDWLYLAGRGEYWDADPRSAAARGIYNFSNGFNPAAAANLRGTENISIWSGTLTAGFNVWKDTLVRLEYRHDEAAGHDNGFINGQSNQINGSPQIRRGQDTIAVNVAYSF